MNPKKVTVLWSLWVHWTVLLQICSEFGEHLNLRSGAANWPPRSSDLRPIETNPLQLTYIEAFIHEITAEMLKKVCKNREDHLKYSGGQHLREILFKH